MSPNTPDWSPFRIARGNDRPLSPRAVTSPEGIGDRLRAAAFAEIQARNAFLWAAGRFDDAPASLRARWRELAIDEDRHLGWLLARMEAVGISPAERPASDALWRSLVVSPTARDFAHRMASAEDRGRQAGERFERAMALADPETARIFGRIACEEIAHIALAREYFPEPYLPVLPNPPSPREVTASSSALSGAASDTGMSRS